MFFIASSSRKWTTLNSAKVWNTSKLNFPTILCTFLFLSIRSLENSLGIVEENIHGSIPLDIDSPLIDFAEDD